MEGPALVAASAAPGPNSSVESIPQVLWYQEEPHFGQSNVQSAESGNAAAAARDAAEEARKLAVRWQQYADTALPAGVQSEPSTGLDSLADVQEEILALRKICAAEQLQRRATSAALQAALSIVRVEPGQENMLEEEVNTTVRGAQAACIDEWREQHGLPTPPLDELAILPAVDLGRKLEAMRGEFQQQIVALAQSKPQQQQQSGESQPESPAGDRSEHSARVVGKIQVSRDVQQLEQQMKNLQDRLEVSMSCLEALVNERLQGSQELNLRASGPNGEVTEEAKQFVAQLQAGLLSSVPMGLTAAMVESMINDSMGGFEEAVHKRLDPLYAELAQMADNCLDRADALFDRKIEPLVGEVERMIHNSKTPNEVERALHLKMDNLVVDMDEMVRAATNRKVDPVLGEVEAMINNSVSGVEAMMERRVKPIVGELEACQALCQEMETVRKSSEAIMNGRIASQETRMDSFEAKIDSSPRHAGRMLASDIDHARSEERKLVQELRMDIDTLREGFERMALNAPQPFAGESSHVAAAGSLEKVRGDVARQSQQLSDLWSYVQGQTKQHDDQQKEMIKVLQSSVGALTEGCVNAIIENERKLSGGPTSPPPPRGDDRDGRAAAIPRLGPFAFPLSSRSPSQPPGGVRPPSATMSRDPREPGVLESPRDAGPRAVKRDSSSSGATVPPGGQATPMGSQGKPTNLGGLMSSISTGGSAAVPAYSGSSKGSGQLPVGGGGRPGSALASMAAQLGRPSTPAAHGGCRQTHPYPEERKAQERRQRRRCLSAEQGRSWGSSGSSTLPPNSITPLEGGSLTVFPAESSLQPEASPAQLRSVSPQSRGLTTGKTSTGNLLDVRQAVVLNEAPGGSGLVPIGNSSALPPNVLRPVSPQPPRANITGLQPLAPPEGDLRVASSVVHPGSEPPRPAWAYRDSPTLAPIAAPIPPQGIASPGLYTRERQEALSPSRVSEAKPPAMTQVQDAVVAALSVRGGSPRTLVRQRSAAKNVPNGPTQARVVPASSTRAPSTISPRPSDSSSQWAPSSEVDGSGSRVSATPQMPQGGPRGLSAGLMVMGRPSVRRVAN